MRLSLQRLFSLRSVWDYLMGERANQKAPTKNRSARLNLLSLEDRYVPDATPVVHILPYDPYASEAGASTGSFLVTRTGSTAEALTVTYTVGGTATAGEDYTTLSGTVEFYGGESSKIITVVPIEDDAGEDNESVQVVLGNGTGYSVGVGKANVTILDSRQIWIAATDATALEGSGNSGAFTVYRNWSAGNTTVAYSVGGSAAAGTDYSALTGNVTFLAGETSKTIVVNPLNDSDVRESRTVQVTLAPAGDGWFDLGANTTATVTIEEDDVSTVNIVSHEIDMSGAWNNAFPGGSYLSTGYFTISRNGVLGDLTVNLTMSGTAMPTDNPYSLAPDYFALPGSVVIPNGANSIDLHVHRAASTIEVDRSVSVALGNSGNYTVGGAATGTISVEGHQAVYIQETNAAIYENNTSGITIFRVVSASGPVASDLEVFLEYFNTSFSPSVGESFYAAEEGADYLPLPTSVIIKAGNSTADVTLYTINDSVAEIDEWKLYGITPNANYSVGRYLLGRHQPIFYINDDDTAGVVRVTADVTSATEPSGNGTITIERYSPDSTLDTSNSLTVNYELNFGNATPGVDYVALSGNVVIPANQTSVTVNIVPINDGLREGNESFFFRIAPGNYFVQDLGFWSIERQIIDEANDAPSLAPLSNLTVVANQAIGFTANATDPDLNSLGQPQGLLYSLVDPPEGAAIDANGTFSWTPTAAQAGRTYTLTVRVTDADPEEPLYAEETFNVTVQSSVIVRAIDPDAAEGDGGGTGVFQFLRTGDLSQNLTVTYLVAGSATPDDDYTSLYGEVTFYAGEQAAYAYVSPVVDNLPDDGEWVVVQLTAGAGYVLGAATQATITIHDRPAVPPGFCPDGTCGTNTFIIRQGTNEDVQSPNPNNEAPVRYADGTVRLFGIDLAANGLGGGWGVTRSWSNGPGYANGQDGGAGWVISQTPRLMAGDNGSIAVVGDGQAAWVFDGESPRTGGAEKISYNASTDTYTVTTGMGDKLVFAGFSPAYPAARRGQFESVTWASGVKTAVTEWTAEGRITTIESLSGSVIETWTYDRVTSGSNAGRLSLVTRTLSADAGATNPVVESVEYTYYGEGESHGNPGDLKTAAVIDPEGVIGTSYYRYYTAGEPGGFQHGLKYAFEPAAFERLAAGTGNAFSASDAAAAPFADNYYEYDDQYRVVTAISSGEGCSSCSGGQGEYTFTYTSSTNAPGANSWMMKTVETLPDGNQNVVYTNQFGQIMLAAYQDTTTSQEWVSYNRFDSYGRIVLSAAPSAVSGYDDQYADLVHVVSGNAEFLRDSDGLLTIYSDFLPVADGPEAYLSGIALRHGELGANVPQWAATYGANTVDDVTVYNITSETVFRNANGTGNQTTTYAYSYHAGTNAVESVVTTLPVVSGGQNGSGTASVSTVVYDREGRPVWTKDAAGVISYAAYDAATGGVVKVIEDVDTDLTTNFTGLPTGWSNPAGVNLVTTYEVDDRGRTIKETGPDGMVTFTVYRDADHEIRVYMGWDASTSRPTLLTSVYRENWAAGYTEMFTMTAAPGVVGGRPSGNEAVSELRSLSRSYVNDAGQIVTSEDYFNTLGLSYSTGSMGNATAHFDESVYGYDARGRQAKTVSPSGTIYRTEYDGLGRVVSEWVGTDDTPTAGFWSPANLAGTNMVKVAEYEYDYGNVGDSRLTKTTHFTGNTTLAPNIVAEMAYDWRGRVVGLKGGSQGNEATDVNRPITVVDYDNLDQVTRTRVYDGDAVALVDGNGTLQIPSSSLLRAQSQTYYDDLGRVYKTQKDNVNPANGTVGNASLTAETWYDERGLVRKQTQPNGPVTKRAYDSFGRLTVAFTTDGKSDANYTQALSVSDDTVLEQTEYVYDDAGRVIQTISRQRFHDATGNGPLGNASGSQPKARVYNTGYFYDLAGRPTDVVDIGTNGNAAWTVPGSVPLGSATVLVTHYDYGADGRVRDVVDPKGTVTRSTYDGFGRTLSTVEDYGGANKTTLYTYGAAGMTSLTAVNADTGNQTTQWVYGVTVAGGSGINSNDVVGETRHPDPTTGVANATMTDTVRVSALGQTLSTTDRNGTIHQYSYDVLGRPILDELITGGAGIIVGSVRKLAIAYDGQGNAYLFTSLNSSNGIVNQVKRDYNGLGQLVTEWQAQSGYVYAATPKVQYTYSEMAGGANHSRLTAIVYPSGYTVNYNYDSGLDGNISRLSSLSDSSGTLEAYDYLGLGTVVVRSHPQPDVDLSYLLQTPEAFGDAGDQYNGLDRFGRVVDQRWLDGNGTSVDRYQYGYDQNSNRLWRDNLANASFGELYAYDALGQLTSAQRGVLNGNHTGLTGNATRAQSWDLDPLGNWNGVTTDGVTQARDHNAQNEITSVGNATSPQYMPDGSMSRDEQGKLYSYNAWGQLVRVRTSGGTILAEYGYDATGRRNSEGAGGVTTILLNSAGWQVLEEKVGANTTQRYVWSPEYVDAMVLRDRDSDGNGSLDERLWVQQDANWNVTSVVDGSGMVVERYVYDAYGVRTVLDAGWVVLGGSPVEWLQGFQGMLFDEATGLLGTGRVRGTPYSATLGRWISSDPIGFAAGVNTYAFVAGSPGNYVDPSGLIWETIAGLFTWSENRRGTALDDQIRERNSGVATDRQDIPTGALKNSSLGTWEGQNYQAAGIASAAMIRGLVAEVGKELFLEYSGGKGAQFVAHLASKGIAISKGVFVRYGKELKGNELKAVLYDEAKAFGVCKPPMRYKLKPVDLDWRGSGKSSYDALQTAFAKAGHPKSEFVATKWGKSVDGKTVPVEWRHKSGAEVNVDWSHSKNGPDAPHVGWQTSGKNNTVGHIILDTVHATR